MLCNHYSVITFLTLIMNVFRIRQYKEHFSVSNFSCNTAVTVFAGNLYAPVLDKIV